MTHDVSGFDWKNYKHPLPEHMYDVYMEYWKKYAMFSERLQLVRKAREFSPQRITSTSCFMRVELFDMLRY
jgi:hypothetical protein